MLNVQQFPFKNSSITLGQNQFKQLDIKTLKVHLLLITLAMFEQ